MHLGLRTEIPCYSMVVLFDGRYSIKLHVHLTHAKCGKRRRGRAMVMILVVCSLIDGHKKGQRGVLQEPVCLIKPPR